MGVLLFMENSYSSIITPITSRLLNKNFEELYRILKKSSPLNNLYQKNIKMILEVLQENNGIELDSEDDCINFFSIIINFRTVQIKLLLKFLMEENLVILNRGKLKITDYGKLFLLSDKITQSIDIVRYFWEKLDWEELCSDRNNDYIVFGGRRYVASIFSQLDIRETKINDSMGVMLKDNVLFWNINKVLFEILNNKSMCFIINEILEPIGLISLIKCNKTQLVSINETSRIIFDYYSQGMIEEYNQMVEECWESYDKGNFQEAFDFARNILKVVNNIEAYNIIGCVYIKRKEYDKAKETFNYAISLLEKQKCHSQSEITNMDIFISLYFNLGLCYYYSEDLIRALHIFKEIKSTLPYILDRVEEIILSIKNKIVLDPVNS